MSCDTMWHSRHFSSQNFLISFIYHEEGGYQLEVVDTHLRHWRENATHEHLTARCQEFLIFECNPSTLVKALEQALYQGYDDNIEILEISDTNLKLIIKTIQTVKVNIVLLLERVGDVDKLDRKWVVDNFMPLLALYAHRESATLTLDGVSEDSVSSNSLLPSDVKTFEIFEESNTREKYLKFKLLLRQKYESRPSSPEASKPPEEVTPPIVPKTTTTTTTKKQKTTPEESKREEQMRREELSKKRTSIPTTAAKKKRRLL